MVQKHSEITHLLFTAEEEKIKSLIFFAILCNVTFFKIGMIKSYAVLIILFHKLNTTKPVSYKFTGLSWCAKEN